MNIVKSLKREISATHKCYYHIHRHFTRRLANYIQANTWHNVQSQIITMSIYLLVKFEFDVDSDVW